VWLLPRALLTMDTTSDYLAMFCVVLPSIVMSIYGGVPASWSSTTLSAALVPVTVMVRVGAVPVMVYVAAAQADGAVAIISKAAVAPANRIRVPFFPRTFNKLDRMVVISRTTCGRTVPGTAEPEAYPK